MWNIVIITHLKSAKMANYMVSRVVKLSQQMREAARLYSKNRSHDNTSSIFKSTIEREGCQGGGRSDKVPGPGSYDITLPLVKPKYEAIVKKNRSIIIKVNDIQMPGFASRQPRFFRQYATIPNETSMNQLTEFQMTRQQIEQFSKPKNAYRYNFSLARKRSQESISSSHFLTNKNIQPQSEEVSKAKGTNWSKYKQPRRVWNSVSEVPGPGSYQASQRKEKKYFYDNISWQFRSETKRVEDKKRKDNKYKFRLDVEENQGSQKFKSIHSRQKLTPADEA